MNHIKSYIAGVLAAVAATVLLGACNENKDDPGFRIPNTAVSDFATYAASSDNGSVFELRKDGDSELITLTSKAIIKSDNAKVGDRMIIVYSPSGGQMVYQSGPIDLYGFIKVLNGGVEPLSKTLIQSERTDPVHMCQITRTGQYLNIWLEAGFRKEPEKFALVADEATLDDEYPMLYLIYRSDYATAAYTQLYASFDLSSVWNKSTCKGVNIHYDNTVGDNFSVFTKSTVLDFDQNNPE